MAYKSYIIIKAPKMPPSPTLLSNQNRKKGQKWPLMAFDGKKFTWVILIIF